MAAFSPSTIPSSVGFIPMRFGEMARSAASVLLAKVLVTVGRPAAAISSGTRLGCGVSISDSPTSKPGSMSM